MLRRFGIIGLLLAGAFSLTGGAVGQDSELPVVVVELNDPFDQRLIEFAADTLATTPAHLFVLRVDAPGISSGDPGALYQAIADAPAPVVVWVGGLPAVAYGGVGSLLNVADLGSAAPGAGIGYLDPAVVTEDEIAPIRVDRFPGATEDERRATAASITAALESDSVAVQAPISGYVDHVVPTIGQLIVGLDGEVLRRGEAVFEISTADQVVSEDGTAVASPSRSVEFVKPDLWTRFLRLSARPEATLFFLIAGIVAATFEFYAAGAGIAAAASVLAFLLAGYGLATLPVSWPSVGGVVGGLVLYNWDFQRQRIGWRSIGGTVALAVGGLTITAARPQFAPAWWIVLAIITGTGLFYGIALTSIVRSRFSTTEIARDQLVGSSATVETVCNPEGTVVISNGSWAARSSLKETLEAGERVDVVGVDGFVLEVVSGRTDHPETD